jgi:hypothetical protein
VPIDALPLMRKKQHHYKLDRYKRSIMESFGHEHLMMSKIREENHHLN